MTGTRTLGYLTLDSAPGATITAAAAAGFESVGIRITGRRIADPFTQVLGNKAAIADLGRRSLDTGVAISNISAYHFHPDVQFVHLKQVVDATAELGAGIIVANSYDPDESVFVEKMVEYCEYAARTGIRIVVEFMRYSAVKSIHDAGRVVAAIGAANLGILIDPLHLARSGGTPADIGRIDPKRLFFAQLCDAKPVAGMPPEDYFRIEARTGRLYPGDGCLPLREFLAALPADVEIEYEVPRQDLGLLTLDERAKVACSVFNSFLDAPAARAA